MITIISGTNRKNSRTLKVAQYYKRRFEAHGQNPFLLSLEQMHILCNDNQLRQIEAEYLIPSDKFVIIMPEYNGSFPGVLKLLLDQSTIEKCWWYKKAMLVGLADGRGGNIRGIDHLTGIMHYLKMNIFYNSLAISKIKEEINQNGEFLKDKTIRSIEEQITSFIEF